MNVAFLILGLAFFNILVAVQFNLRRGGIKTRISTREARLMTKRELAAGQWAAHVAVSAFFATAMFVLNDRSTSDDLLVFPAAAIPAFVVNRLALKYLPRRSDDDEPARSGTLKI